MEMKTKWSQILDTAKAVIRVKYIAIWAYKKTKQNKHSNNLNLHLKELQKVAQSPKVVKGKK